jgi:hypothetical protein
MLGMASEETEMKKCSETDVCEHLENRLVDGGKGFKAMHTVRKDEKSEARFFGVAYMMSAKDKGLMLNVSPFCGGKPGYFERDI